MSQPSTAPYAVTYDLTNCAAEPVHLIRHYQAPACCLLIEPLTCVVKAHSTNFPVPHGLDTLMGVPLSSLLPAATAQRVEAILLEDDPVAHNPLPVSLDGALRKHNLIIARSGDHFLLEFEPLDDKVSSFQFLNRMDEALRRIQSDGEADDLYERIPRRIKNLTGFDRVMLYRFDEAHNGQVIAEAKEKEMRPFLGLYYPHTDFPLQARQLLLDQRNPIRHIVDTDPADVNALVAEPGVGPIDLTQAANRGTSPIHLQYLRNMKVGASLAIGLVVEGKLWGLIACHHRTPKFLDYRVRSLLGLLARVVSGHLSLHLTTAYREKILGTRLTQSRLFEAMSAEYDIVKSLTGDTRSGLLELTDATGAFLVLDGKIHPLGQCPEAAELTQLVHWLAGREEDFFASSNFFEAYPAASSFRHPPAGVMSINFGPGSDEYIVWLLPEIRKTVTWGGNPEGRKMITDGKAHLNPDMSFKNWEQKVSGQSRKWESYQIDAAYNLRDSIREVIMLKYQEVRQLNDELSAAYKELETFSYTVSHDLRAPLRNIKGFVEILQEDYAEELDDYGRNALGIIINSVGKMNNFINDILSYSRLGQVDSVFGEVDLNRLFSEVWYDYASIADQLEMETDLRETQVIGDYVQLSRMMQNLVSNAVKYSAGKPAPKVKVSSFSEGDKVIIEVSDNGIGIDMIHAERIFSVFNRLVSEDEYEGTGVGLALVKRIVDKHNGSVSVSSKLGEGTTFRVELPAAQAAQVIK